MRFLKTIFGSKKQPLVPADLSQLGIDVHSHLIPGIDDGAQTIEESLQLLEAFQNMGYKKVITTPHVMSDYYKNTPKIILDGLAILKEAMVQKGLTIQIDAAAEYNLDADFEPQIIAKTLLTFGSNYVLFELPFFQEPPMLNDIIWKLKSNGYEPVLAHAERYSFWHKTPHKIEEIRDRGVAIQLNINSLTGHYGPEVKKTAEWMVDQNLVDLLGSDCHNMNHINLMKNAICMTKFHQILANDKLINKKLAKELEKTDY